MRISFNDIEIFKDIVSSLKLDAVNVKSQPQSKQDSDFNLIQKKFFNQEYKDKFIQLLSQGV